MGVVRGCGLQEAGVASRWNLWVWLECIGVVSGCCKEVYRFCDNITHPYFTCISSFLKQHPIPTAFFILICFLFLVA